MDEEIKKLLSQGKKLEAVRLVHKSLDCSLKDAKDYVDAMERGEKPGSTSRSIRGWNITYKDDEVVDITVNDEYGRRHLRKGSREWDDVIAESRQKGHGRIKPEEPNLWQRIWFKDGDNKQRFSQTAMYILVIPMCIFSLAFLYVLIFLEDFCEGYVGLFRYLLGVLMIVTWAVMAFANFINHKSKWYIRLISIILSVVLSGGALIGMSMLVVDIVGNRQTSYEGKFSLKEERYHGTLIGYKINWKNDQSFFHNEHYITTAHYKLLQRFQKVRVVFWENTGVVKAIEPKLP